MKRALLGFIAGFLATITFHQIALALLHAAHSTPRGAWSMQPVPPFGVPSVISLSFWGDWNVVNSNANRPADGWFQMPSAPLA